MPSIICCLCGRAHVRRENIQIRYHNRSIVCKKCYIKVLPPRSHCARDPPYSRHPTPVQSSCPALKPTNKQLCHPLSPQPSTSRFQRPLHHPSSPQPSTSKKQANAYSSSTCPSTSQSAPSSESSSFADPTQSSESSRAADYENEENRMEYELSENPSSFAGSRESQNASSMSQLTQTTNQSNTSQSSTIFVKNIPACSSTQSRYFICGGTLSRRIIPRPALQQAWREKQIFIPPKNRVCAIHLDKKKFTISALSEIEANKEGFFISSTNLGDWILDISAREKALRVEFTGDDLTDKEIFMLTGYSKANFHYLATFLSTKMRNTENRKYLNCLGMMLILLRHNATQPFIAFLFNTTQQIVSDGIESVSEILNGAFVDKHLGFQHLSDDELKTHSRGMFTTVLSLSENCKILLCDGTYLFTEKPQEFWLQRKTYSLHKHGNLHKPMMCVLPSGYILAVEGLFYADNANNDANILLAMIKEAEGNVMKFIREQGEVALVVDRGFKFARQEAKAVGVKFFMPECLNNSIKQKQFTTQQANNSRLVTMCRFVVETANGRIKKKYRFFCDRICGHYRNKIWKLFRIGCAMINAFCGPLFTETEKHLRYAELALQRVHNANELQTRILENNLERLTLSWQAASASTVVDFPRMTMEELESLTLGPYQLEIARRYIDQHLREDGDFQIRLHRTVEGVLRAQIFSRHSASGKYYVWVSFDATNPGIEGITVWYCKCKTGARTCGMCAHVACVLRYMCYERHLPPEELVRRETVHHPCFRDAGAELEADSPDIVVLAEDTSDEED